VTQEVDEQRESKLLRLVETVHVLHGQQRACSSTQRLHPQDQDVKALPVWLSIRNKPKISLALEALVIFTERLSTETCSAGFPLHFLLISNVTTL
jgi:hypothetical protein